MTDEIQAKLMKVMEYFLSLHEADEIYHACFDYNVSEDDIVKMLDGYREEK